MTRKFTNPLIFGPSVAVLPTGRVQAVSYWVDGETVTLERVPVLALAILPDWEGGGEEMVGSEGLEYEAGTEEDLYTVKAIGLNGDGPPTYFRFLDDGTVGYCDPYFVGYDDGTLDETFWQNTAEEAHQREVQRKAKRDEGRTS